MIQTLTLKLGSGDIMTCYDAMGLQFMECNKKFPLDKVPDKDFAKYFTGKGVTIDFTSNEKIHEFYSCLCCVSRSCPRFVFDNVTFDFGSRPNKKSIDNVKSAVKIWIKKKIEYLQMLDDDTLTHGILEKEDIG